MENREGNGIWNRRDGDECKRWRLVQKWIPKAEQQKHMAIGEMSAENSGFGAEEPFWGRSEKNGAKRA